MSAEPHSAETGTGVSTPAPGQSSPDPQAHAPAPLIAEPAAPTGTDGGLPAPPAVEFPAWAPPLPDPAALGDEPQQYRPQTDAEFEASLDAPAYSPGSYRLPSMIEGEEPTPQENLALQGIQSLLWHGDFPVNAGNRLMDTIAEEARRLGEDMDDATFELQCRSTDATLQRIYGEERYAELRGKLSHFLTDLGRKTPGGLDDLIDTYGHVLATPRVMAELLGHVDRLAVRKRK